MRTTVLAIAALLAVELSAAPTLPDVLSCGRVGSAGGLGAGTELTRHTINTGRFPAAVCNDGTPAVFYYGPATKDADRNKWLIFLQGGGSCRDGESCARRWCSSDTNFGMDKMTSSLSKESIRANGFLSPGAENQFGTWNRVLVYYCSSDQWSGTRTTTVRAVIGSSGEREYDIHFRGSSIVDAVFETLRIAGGRQRIASPLASDDVAWPDLDDATHVIFAGSSGGGNGVRNNADRVGAKLSASNPNLVEFRAIIEAIYGGQGDQLDFTNSAFCAMNPAGCAYESWYQASWEVDRSFHGARVDESCVWFHSTVQAGTEWRCADNEHVLLHHVTTPFFFRQDMLDSNIGSSYAESRFGTLADYARQVESELRNLPVPEEPGASPSGLFVPQCADHESFTNNRDVFDVRVDGRSYHDVVSNWWTGKEPQKVIRQFTGIAVPAPECPPR